MQSCPHCNKKIKLAELRYQGMFKNYRICPYCHDYVTVDKKTKRRQVIFLLIVMASLVLTILLYFEGTKWLVPTLISYLIFGIYLYWANQRVFLVPYKKEEA